MNEALFEIKLERATSISEDIDTTLNDVHGTVLALCVRGGSYEGKSFINVLNPDQKITLDQKVYKLINKNDGFISVASLDNPTDFIGLKRRQVLKRFPQAVYGTVNKSIYGNIVKSQEEDIWFEWGNDKRIKMPVNIAPVINNIVKDNIMPVAKRIGDKDISVFLEIRNFGIYSELPVPTSHKIYPIKIMNQQFYAVKSKKDNRTFFDVATGQVLFKTPKPVSSVINSPVNGSEYLIQGADKKFYRMTFQKYEESNKS